jgi:hypothetical protein
MKQILITCDTEVGEITGNKPDAFETFIEGKIENLEVGYKLINDISTKYDATVEHFVDVYPFERYGEDKFKNLCQNILDNGHKIGLHTHPSGKYDKKRRYMWQYSFEEQNKIIKFGKSKIKEWTGYDVLSHRAGGYGADDNTLKALKQNNILIDSSFYYLNDKCKIKYPLINKSSMYQDIYQIPVTIYEKTIKYFPLNKKRKSYLKLDFRYGSSSKDILEVIKQMPEDSIIVLFLHSFNFLNLPYNFKTKQYDKISINNKLINEYEKLLKGISAMDDALFTSTDRIVQTNKYDDKIVSIVEKSTILKPIINRIIGLSPCVRIPVRSVI